MYLEERDLLYFYRVIYLSYEILVTQSFFISTYFITGGSRRSFVSFMIQNPDI